MQAQGLIDVRGDYEPLPKSVRVGQTVRVVGELAEPVRVGGVALSRIEPRGKLTTKHLNSSSRYRDRSALPELRSRDFRRPTLSSWSGASFSGDVRPSERERPGRYGVSVWGLIRIGAIRLLMVSLRSIDVR